MNEIEESKVTHQYSYTTATSSCYSETKRNLNCVDTENIHARPCGNSRRVPRRIDSSVPRNLEIRSMSFGKEISGTPSSSVTTRNMSKADGQRPSNCEMNTHQEKTHPEIFSLHPVSFHPPITSSRTPPSDLSRIHASPSARVELWRIQNEIWNEMNEIDSRSTGWT